MNRLLIFIVPLVLGFQGGDKYTLKVDVTGLKPLKGDLYVSLHSRPEYFQVADSALMKLRVAVNSENEVVTFDNVPAGTYAIAAYHDENLNGIMDANEKGFPKEGYGFSIKTKIFGRPNFGQAAFSVTGNQTEEIKMVYPPGAENN